MEPLNWQHIAAEALVYLIPTLGGLGGLGYLGYRKLIWTLREHRPHSHHEKTGILYVDGIGYPREEVSLKP